MATQSSTTKFTYDEYLFFPNDGKRHDLIDGDRYVNPASRMKHQRVSQNLSGLFYAYLAKTNIQRGYVFCAPTDVVLSEFDVGQPDLLYVSSA